MNCIKYKLENFRNSPIFNICPNCGNDKTYQRYVSILTGIQVANDVGQCKTKIGCGYHYTAWRYEEENNITLSHKKGMPSFIPNEYFLKSLNNCKANNLFLFIAAHLGENEAIKAFKTYSVGTSMSCPGATVFWQIDREDKKRTGRIALFDAETGKENGSWWTSKGWVHRSLNLQRFNFVDCPFGWNLLNKEPAKPVVFVYTEKTAMLGSCLYPEFIWLAMVNGKEAPNLEICQVLSRRDATWFPSGGFDKLKRFE